MHLSYWFGDRSLPAATPSGPVFLSQWVCRRRAVQGWWLPASPSLWPCCSSSNFDTRFRVSVLLLFLSSLIVGLAKTSFSTLVARLGPPAFWG